MMQILFSDICGEQRAGRWLEKMAAAFYLLGFDRDDLHITPVERKKLERLLDGLGAMDPQIAILMSVEALFRREEICAGN